MVTITQLPNLNPQSGSSFTDGDTYGDNHGDNDTATPGAIVLDLGSPPRAWFVMATVAVIFYLLGKCQKG